MNYLNLLVKIFCYYDVMIHLFAIFTVGYTKSVDFWSLGILLFELLTRRTPFASYDDHNNDNIVRETELLSLYFYIRYSFFFSLDGNI